MHRWSPDNWHTWVMVPGALGLAMMVFGQLADAPFMVLVGCLFVAPLLVGAIVAITIGVPLGLMVRIREARTPIPACRGMPERSDISHTLEGTSYARHRSEYRCSCGRRYVMSSGDYSPTTFGELDAEGVVHDYLAMKRWGGWAQAGSGVTSNSTDTRNCNPQPGSLAK